MAHAANALLSAFRGATTLSVKKIAQDEAFMKATFDGQKSALVQCVRFMLEQGVVALVEEGALTEESVFVLKDGKEDKRNVKEIRLERMFQPHVCPVWLESLDCARCGELASWRCLCRWWWCRWRSGSDACECDWEWECEWLRGKSVWPAWPAWLAWPACSACSSLASWRSCFIRSTLR